jgi:dynein heavy chain, axonemal
MILTHIPSLLLSSPLFSSKASLDATLSLLKAAQDTLSNAEKQISILEASFAEANAKREQLAYDVEQCRVRLVRAQSLMGGLASEKIRWTDTYQSLSSTYENLVGDALVSAGSIGNSACNILS